MNQDSPIDPRSALESSLTALLLGELPHDQAAALHQKLAQDAELAKLYQRLKQTINLVCETVASPAAHIAGQPTPLKLSDERRQKLLQQFKTVAPKEFVPPRRRATSWLVPVGIAAVLMSLLAATLLPALSKAKSRSMGHSFGTWALSKSAAPAPEIVNQDASSSEEMRNAFVRARRSAVDKGLSQQAAEAKPPAEFIGRIEGASSAIVLPRGAEPAEVPTTPGSMQAGFTVSGTTKGFYDDSLGRAGGVGGAGTFGGFAGGIEGKTPAAEGRPAEVAAGNFFFSQPEAPAVLDAMKETEGMQTLTKRSSAPEVAARSSFGRGFQAGSAITPGGPVPTPPSVVSAPATDVLDEAAPRPSTPAPVRALTLTFPADNLELGRAPSQTHGADKTAGDRVGGRAVISDFGGVSAGTETLHYQWGNVASAQPGQISSDGEKAPILGDLPVAGQLFRSAADNAAGSLKQKLQPIAVPPADGKQDWFAANHPGNTWDLRQKSYEDKDSLGVPFYANQSSTPNLNFSRGDDRQSPAGQTTTRRDEAITAGAARARTEERVKSVELADTYSLGDKMIGSRVEASRPASRGANVDNLGVVGYAISPTAHASVTTGLPSQGATVERYAESSQMTDMTPAFNGVSRPTRSPIALPSSPSEPSLARNYNSGKDLELLAAANKPGAGPSPLGDTRKQGADEDLERKKSATALVQDGKLLYEMGKLDEADAKLKRALQENPQDDAALYYRKLASEAKVAQAAKTREVTLRQDISSVDQDPANPVKRELLPGPPAAIPQPEVQTAENAFSTFSLNVSDVSFKLAAASLEKGVMPEPATVRSEEFINAFDYRDPEPPPGVPVAFAWERAQYPFAQNRDLLRFSIKTAALGRQPGRPLNLVLLLDNSGSMERADRVSIIREALRVLAGQLQPQDKFSVVTFARTAHLWVDGVPGNQAAQVAEQVSGLTPQGGTNLEDALNLAYQTALRHYLADGVNRVVLLTDGAANLGDVAPEALKQKVEANRKQGIALDCFGIGWEGYNDDLLEVLSRNGDGRYGFVNTPEEAATEFAGQLAGALHVAASDVKVQVEFNPARVTAYRQIGYAKHQLTKQQFRDNTVDAAEIGAAESGNALYVVEANPRGDGSLATVRVRYKVPGTTDYHEHEWPVPYTGNAVALEQASPAMRLAATASAFSEWLVSSPYAGEVSPDRLLGYLRGVPEVYGADSRPKKLEWMVRQAKSISGK